MVDPTALQCSTRPVLCQRYADSAVIVCRKAGGRRSSKGGGSAPFKGHSDNNPSSVDDRILSDTPFRGPHTKDSDMQRPLQRSLMSYWYRRQSEGSQDIFFWGVSVGSCCLDSKEGGNNKRALLSYFLLGI